MVDDIEKQEPVATSQSANEEPIQEIDSPTLSTSKSEDMDLEKGRDLEGDDDEVDEAHGSDKEIEAAVRSPSSVDSIEECAEPAATEPVSRSRSRASTTRSRQAVIVTRGNRRGLLSRFTLLPEVENPYDYSDHTKWIITCLVAFAAAAAPLGSAIFFRM